MGINDVPRFWVQMGVRAIGVYQALLPCRLGWDTLSVLILVVTVGGEVYRLYCPNQTHPYTL